MPRRLLALAALALLAAPALAGCASKDAPEPVRSVSGGSVGGSASGATVADQPPPPAITGTSARWHFHDYWKGKPVITLLDTHVNLTPGAGGLSSIVTLPQGVIVPPETGYLTINVSWAAPSTGVVNLTYRPSDSQDFLPFHDAPSGKPLFLNTTESMCDVPHRQESLWRFNLTAMPGSEVPPGLPATELHVEIKATIGRPLFIDPPHFNWWQDQTVLPLVATVRGDLATGVTPAGNATVPDATSLVPPSVPPRQDRIAATVTSANQSARVPVTPGRIVPEGAQTVVVLLNWTSDVPGAPKLKVTYEEANNPSSGAMPVSVDGDHTRIFVVQVQPPQTDTTYSNRTTWQFHVLPETDGAAAFKGSYVFTAWVTRLSVADAVKMAQGGGAPAAS